MASSCTAALFLTILAASCASTELGTEAGGTDGPGGPIAFVASAPKPMPESGTFSTSTYQLPEPTDVYTVGTDGTGIARLTADGAPKASLAWSPDGARLAYTAYPLGTHHEQLWMFEGTGSEPEMVCVDCTGTFLLPPPGAMGDSYIGPEPGWAQLEWSPDGRWLAAPATDTHDLTLIAPGSGKIVTVPTDQVRGIAWSPDSRSVAFTAGGFLEVYDVTSDNVRRVASVGYLPGGPVAWSPDGKLIAAVDSVRRPHIIDEGVFVVEVASGEKRTVVPVDGTYGVYDVAWSPDSARLALLYHPIDPPTASLMTIGADGSGARDIALCENREDPDGLCAGNGGSVAWSPAGDQLLYVNYDGPHPHLLVWGDGGSTAIVSGELVPGCCLAWSAS